MLFSKTLSVRGDEFIIRTISKDDNEIIKAVIIESLTKFLQTHLGEGTALQDESLNDMTSEYSKEGSLYYVIEHKGLVIGGAGFAPLKGGDSNTCELQKLYLSNAAQGKGLAKILVNLLLEAARNLGYTRCYLETLTEMTAAQSFYENLGFTRCERMGKTGHHACNVQFVKDI